MSAGRGPLISGGAGSRRPAAPLDSASVHLLRPGWRRHIAVASILGALLLVAFSNTLRDTEFVLDSKLLVLQDPRLAAPLHDAVRQIFTRDYWWPHYLSCLSRPLPTFSD